MRNMRSFGIILAPSLRSPRLRHSARRAGYSRSSRCRRSRGTTAMRRSTSPSERIEVQDRADRAVFTGNVHVTQADLTLDTQRLTVAYSGGEGTTAESRSTGSTPPAEWSCTARRKPRRATSAFTTSTASSSP